MAADEPPQIDHALVVGLFLEHEQSLRRFLQGVLRNPQAANDALQTTFTRLMERGHEVRPESLKSWLYRVAFHEAIQLRRQGQRSERILQRAAWSRQPESRAPEEPLIQFEQVERVRLALTKLPPAQQQIVRMKMYEDKTFAEIAKELGIPLGTALARMRAALTKLKQQLHPEP